MKKRTDAEWTALIEEHEMAYFRGELAMSSPESYNLDEMREISAGMDESTAKAEAAMHEDFQSWSLQAQARMLDLLQKADPGHFDWWLSILVGDMPDSLSDVSQ